jgi:hypothetical protein
MPYLPSMNDPGDVSPDAPVGIDPPDPGPGLLERWSLNPSAVHRELWARLQTNLEQSWTTFRPLIVMGIAITLSVGVLLWWLRARAWRRARDSARWVEVLPPAATGAEDGPAMWRQLTGLLRPGALGARMRLLTWELHAGHEQVHAGLWVPGSINPAHVVRAVSGAYPRSRVSAGLLGTNPGPLLPPPRPAPPGLLQRARERIAWERGRPAPVRRPASVGYVLVPRISMWLPLLADPALFAARSRLRASRTRSAADASDPLGMLCLCLASTPPGYRTIVQVLARPLPPGTRSAARRVRRSGGAPPGPGPAGLSVLGLVHLGESAVRAVLDLATPGPGPADATRPTGRVVDAGVDPVTRQQHREAAAKAAGELVEICVRVMVCGPNRRRCRERAWEAANSLRAVITAQGSDTIRLPHPEATITSRTASNWRAAGLRLSSRAGHWRGWFVATDTEVGALARLPLHPALYRFDVTWAPHLPAPTQIPRIHPTRITPLNGVPMEQVWEPSATTAIPEDETPASAEATSGFGSGDLETTDPDETPEDWDSGGYDWENDRGGENESGGDDGCGWDEDFPELGWDEDGDPEDGFGPEGGYRGEAA